MDIFNQPRMHFRVATGIAHVALTDWRNRRLAVEKELYDFAKSLGGIGFFNGSDDNVGNGVAIHAVIFEGNLPLGWKARKWKSFNGLAPNQIAAWPDKRTTVGKSALQAIKELPLRPSSSGPCDIIGFPSSLSYASASGTGSLALGLFETLKAGWIEEVFYVSLPDERRIRVALETEGKAVDGEEWQPLFGMERILKEEVDLAYARHKATAAKGGAA